MAVALDLRDDPNGYMIHQRKHQYLLTNLISASILEPNMTLATVYHVRVYLLHTANKLNIKVPLHRMLLCHKHLQQLKLVIQM